MNVFRLAGFAYPEGPRLLARGRFIPLTEAPDAFEVTNAICDLALHHFADGRAFVPALEWAVNEIIDNIAVHAEPPRPGLVCAQYYPKRHRLEVAVVDAGRGILASLREGHDVQTHADAISLALQRGITRSRDIGQGNGLAGTREIVHANGGYLALWTGDVKFRMSKGEETGFVRIPHVPGTGLVLALDTRRPVDLRQTFIQGMAWSYIEATAQAMNEGGLRLVDSCSFFGARPPAKRLRRKIHALLPEMTKPLILDFEGVPTASSSFLDELLGRLAEELGPEEYQRRIQVRNATDAVRERANVVISQRVGVPKQPETPAVAPAPKVAAAPPITPPPQTYRRLFRGSELNGWSFDFAGWVGLRLAPDDAEALLERIADLGLRDFCDRLPTLWFDTRSSRDRGGPGSYDTRFEVGLFDEARARAEVRTFLLAFLAERRDAGLPGGAVEHLARPTNGRKDSGPWGEERRVVRIGRDHNLLPDGRRLWALLEPASGPKWSEVGPAGARWPLSAFPRTDRSRLAQVRAGDPILAFARTPGPGRKKGSRSPSVIGLCTATSALEGDALSLSPLTQGEARGLYALVDEPALRDAEPVEPHRTRRLFRVTPAEGHRLAELLGLVPTWPAG